MKKLALFLTLGATVLISQSVFADHRFSNRGFNSWGYNSGFGYNRWGSRYYDPYRFDRYRSRGGSYFNVSYGNRWGPGYGRWGHRRYGRYDAGDLLGGIVLGSLLANSYRDYRDTRSYERVVYRRPVTRTREVVYVNQPQARASSGRKLLRDVDGNCFEIDYNSTGDEVRTQLDPAACAY